MAPSPDRADISASPPYAESVGSKTTAQRLEDLEIGPQATYLSAAAADLPDDHRAYLIARHGTLDLDPLPSADPADPYNWPQWKKTANLACVAFHVSCRLPPLAVMPGAGPLY